MAERDVGHLVLLPEGEEVLDAGLADGEEGAAEGDDALQLPTSPSELQKFRKSVFSARMSL